MIFIRVDSLAFFKAGGHIMQMFYGGTALKVKPFFTSVMKVFWPFLPIFQRLLLLLALPFLSYINYCANGFLCYAVYVNHLLCSSSSKCPLVVKSWKLLNSFDMIWDGNKVLEKVAESSASSWTTHGVDAARTSMSSSSVIQRSWSIRNEKHHSNCQIFSTLTMYWVFNL